MSKQSRKAREARAKADRQPARARRDATGRLHLTLLRDPATGQEQVALTTPLFDEPWQNEIAVGAANTAHATVRGAPSLQAAVDLARNAMAAMSRLAEGLLARAPEGAVACQAGCDHCCYQVVGVTPPEALAIAEHLKTTLSGPALARITAHVAAARERTRGLSSAERFSPEHPCPFLAAGNCSIYEVRPLPCRGMNSLDAGECAKRLRDPDERAAFLAHGFGGHSYLEPIRAFHAISAGLQLGLSELYHLDMRPLDLTAVMDLLLSGDADAPDAWVNGEHPFEAAVRHETTNDPGLLQTSGARAPKP